MPAAARLSRLAAPALALALGLPAAARAEGPPPCQVGETGCYLDGEGQPRDEGAAYRAVIARPRPLPLRAVVESGFALVAGAARFWLQMDHAHRERPGLPERLHPRAWRYDDNYFPTNFVGHPVSGAGWHVIARSNDVDFLGATFLGFAASAAWELIVEMPEIPSLNDMIITTGAGVPLGEFLHWSGRYLNSAPADARWWHRMARWTVGLPRTLHLTVDGHSETLPGPPDHLGLSSAIWHQFRFGYGASVGRASGQAGLEPGDPRMVMQQLRFEGRLAALPGYLAPGRFRRPFSEGNVSALELRLAGGVGGRGVDLLSDAIVVGVHDQAIPWPGEPGLGRAITLGVGVGYRYRHELFGPWCDRLGVLHLPGPAIDGFLIGDGFRLRAAARAQADFAGLHSRPYQQWREANGDATPISSLRQQSYYHGWGASARALVELELENLVLGASASHGRYASHRGRDVRQAEVTIDVDATDRTSDYELWGQLSPFGGRAFLGLRAIRRDRRARLGSFRDSERLELLLIEIGATH